MKTNDQTLIEALLILASDIQCEDGVAVGCIVEGANRIRELTRDDMVLVPREPNDKIEDAILDTGLVCEYGNGCDADKADKLYKAMIAVAEGE
jgi:hypothetical protein